MDLKKDYYTMSKEDFEQYLSQLKAGHDCIMFFKNMETSYFYISEFEINNCLLKLHKAQMELDNVFLSFLASQRNMIKQTCFIDEIQSTNQIENIYSTHSDIFDVMANTELIHNKKIVSIINSYMNVHTIDIHNLYDVNKLRGFYDILMKNAYESKKDMPDGKLFRKGPIYITNGLKSVHTGFYPEEQIYKGMVEYTDFIQKDTIDIYLKLILSHFMIETIHPFYDGNGRFGRYLMTIQCLDHTQSIFSFCISTCINQQKQKYYKALETARHPQEFGCLNKYVEDMWNIFYDGIYQFINSLKNKKTMLDSMDDVPFDMTKSEKKVYDVLFSASILTYFGINNKEIMEYTHISKRTCLSTIKKFRNKGILLDHKLGKIQYHKINIKP